MNLHSTSKRIYYGIVTILVLWQTWNTLLIRPIYGATAAPSMVVTAPKDQAVLVQWASVSGATNYLIEYKLASASNWITFSHPVSSATGITVTGLSNGSSYDFRISTIAGSSQSVPSTVVSATPNATPSVAAYYHILSTGQSLSVGYGGSPALTKSQPYANKMLTSVKTAFTPLIEPGIGAAGAVETMSSAMANMLSSLTPGATFDTIVTLHGVSATAYSGLKKGTAAYNNGMAQIQAALGLAITAQRPYQVAAVTTVHGESDELAGATAAQYEGYLVEWQKDYQTDAQAKTGQTAAVPLFTDQMASWTAYSHAIPHTALGQLSAAKNNPTKIYLVAPKYILDYSDTVHLTNYSYRRLGEYYGKVMKQVLIDGQPWLPVMPIAVVRNNNTIVARFHVPVAPLAFDTTRVDLKTNYGFEYADNTNSAAITKVEIIGGDVVKVTLNKTPTGANQRLRYAYTGVVGSGAGAHKATAPRGNLRDSDITPALYQDSNVPAAMGNYLYNWSVTFDELVNIEATGPLTPTLSPLSGNLYPVQVTITTSDPSGIAAINLSGTAAYSALSCDQSLPYTGSNPVTCTVSVISAGTLSATATDLVGNLSASSLLATFTQAPTPTPTPTSSPTPTVTPTPSPTPTITPTPTNIPQTDLLLTKTVNQTAVQPGDMITFTLMVTNQGPNLATGVQVSDLLPATMGYVSDQPQQGTYDPHIGIWNVGDIAAHSSVTLTLTVKIQ